MRIREYLYTLKYLPLLISTICLIYMGNYKIYHPFWDKQPVMRKITSKYGSIGINPKFNIKLSPSQKFVINKYPIKKIQTFLENNFTNNYNVNQVYLKYILTKGCNICLLEKNKLIGFIHCDPIQIQYKHHSHIFQYVDYLCVDKQYRNKCIAPILISKMIDMYKNRQESFLFKIDYTPLPYQHFISSQYYIKDITKLRPTIVNNVSELTPYNFFQYYNYTNTLLKRFIMRKEYTKDEFFHVFLDKKILNYFIIQNENNIKTIIVGKKNIYNVGNNIFNCFEVDYIIGEMRFIKDVYYSISNYLKLNGYNYISIPCIGSNIKFIKDNDFTRGPPVYYYTYNFSLPHIDINDFCFNLN